MTIINLHCSDFKLYSLWQLGKIKTYEIKICQIKWPSRATFKKKLSIMMEYRGQLKSSIINFWQNIIKWKKCQFSLFFREFLSSCKSDNRSYEYVLGSFIKRLSKYWFLGRDTKTMVANNSLSFFSYCF